MLSGQALEQIGQGPVTQLKTGQNTVHRTGQIFIIIPEIFLVILDILVTHIMLDFVPSFKEDSSKLHFKSSIHRQFPDMLIDHFQKFLRDFKHTIDLGSLKFIDRHGILRPLTVPVKGFFQNITAGCKIVRIIQDHSYAQKILHFFVRIAVSVFTAV